VTVFFHLDQARHHHGFDLVRLYLLSQGVEVKLRSRWAEQNGVPWNRLETCARELRRQCILKIGTNPSLVAETQCQDPMKLLFG
jgi:hypothetical protein